MFSKQKTHLFVLSGHNYVCERCGDIIMEYERRSPICRENCSMVIKYLVEKKMKFNLRVFIVYIYYDEPLL